MMQVVSSFSVKARVDTAMVMCRPAAPEDQGCRGILGMARSEQGSLRRTRAA